MSQLSLSLLGQFQVVCAGQPITAFASDKVRALLVFLAVESERVHTRSTLTRPLWPDYEEESARTNLRQTLYQLRKSLGDERAASPEAPSLLLVTRQTIQFNPAMTCVIDVRVFADLLAACASHRHEKLERCASCLQRLRQAVDLYRGDFLAGFTVVDSSEFEEWRRTLQEQLHLQMLNALTHLANSAELAGNYEQAHHDLQHQLLLEPWREEAHRQLMRVLAAQGQRSAALAQYQRCRQVLAAELNVEPDAATTALYEQIKEVRGGEIGRPTGRPGDKGHPSAVFRPTGARNEGQGSDDQSAIQNRQSKTRNLQDWGEAPITAYFYGRELELAQLQHWLLVERRRLILVLGMGGMGKSTLVARSVTALAEAYDFIFWRSLLNAPPLRQILDEALRFLSRQQLTAVPANLDEQLTLLTTYLQQHHCLLVLDNVESILEAGRVGYYLPGYEGYGRLFERVAQSNHQSSLLLTSRERPQNTTRLAEEGQSVCFLQVAGLASQAGQALLKMRGLGEQANLTADLVARYSGNPLALKLVARTIQEFFAGDIAAFLGDEAPIFDDIRIVLDQQFARLAPLEREILIWLAVEREGVSLDVLLHDLVRAPSKRSLLEAIHALQRRSLLEKTEGGFTLQNVVIEYSTDYLIEQVVEEIETGTFDLLNRHALLKAQAQEHVRLSQVRLILAPIAATIQTRLRADQLAPHFQQLIESLRLTQRLLPGYGAGNLLNLLLHFGIDLRGFDFSHLPVWQAFLRGVELYDADFTGADLSGAAFSDTFGSVLAVATSVDGQWIAAGTSDGEIRLWRVVDHQPVRVIPAHTGAIRAVIFHPDGETLLSRGDDYALRLWEIRTGRLLYTLQGHNDSLRAVALNRDGTLIASASMHQPIHLWDAASGELLRLLPGQPTAVWSMAFCPHPAAGYVLASGSADGAIQLWDVRTGSLLHTLRGHVNEIRCLAFNPAGTLLASGGLDQTICLWQIAPDIVGSTLRQTLAGDSLEVRCVGFSPDGALLIAGGADAIIRLWDLQSHQLCQTLHGHLKGVNALAFAPDGKTCVSGSDDLTLRVWNPQTGQVRTVLHGHTGWVRTLAFCPQPSPGNMGSAQLLASGSDDKTVQIWDVNRGRLLRTLHGHHHWIWSMAFSPDGKLLATGGADHLLHLWSMDERAGTLQAQHTLRQHTNTVRSLLFHPTGSLLVSGGADLLVRFWDPANGRLLDELPGHSGAVDALAFSPGGELLASGSVDRTIRLWEVAHHKPLATLSKHTARIRSLLFSPAPSSTVLASAGEDGAVILWDICVASGRAELRHLLAGHDREVTAIAFHPDGHLLASAGADHTVRLWDVESGQVRHILRGHTDWVRSVSFSANRQVVASCSLDCTIRLWDVASGQLRHLLRGHNHWVWVGNFSPGGEVFASASVDGCIKLWDPHTGENRFTLRPRGPYAGLKISGVTGITEVQRAVLKALGAVDG